LADTQINLRHDHDHGHSHAHDEPFTVPPPDVALRVKALESLLVEKGLAESAAVDAIIDAFETKIGPRNGKAVVVKAWTDPEYRKWLLEDGTRAIASMGYIGQQGERMRVLENTDDTHNLVVCTLCSCYPWALLGLPPVWYKSAPYRSQAVSNPRGVLEQFGTKLSDDVEVRVWDSTSEMRYLVLPQRPEGTEGWSAEKLAALVTRNSMIGVEKAREPAKSGAAA